MSVLLGKGDGSSWRRPITHHHRRLSKLPRHGGLQRRWPPGRGGGEHPARDSVSILLNDGNWTVPPPRITISDVSKAEGKNRSNTSFTFTVSLSAAYDQPVTLSYRTVNGTATAGNDYTSKSGTITFAPGETTKTITIQVKGDNKRESNETFYLDLFGLSSNALFTKNRGIGTILNDDN